MTGGRSAGTKARRGAEAPRRAFPGLIALAAALLLLASLAACGGSDDGAGGPTTLASGPVLLTVTDGEKTVELTQSELEAMGVVEGWGGIKRSTGTIEPPVRWSGVPVEALLTEVGGMEPDEALTMVAKDGYGMTFSYRQLYEQGFVLYDPATGAEEPPSVPITPLIAFEREGEPLGEDEGPLRLVVVQDEAQQVIDGHWTIKWVDRLEVKDAALEWKVTLEGAVPGKIDRQSYVSCSAPGCHGSGWVDDDGAQWTGIPFYLVCGLVDDTKEHDAGAYNARLAEKGYTIEIESADGSVTRIDSRTIAGKDNVVLAGRLDGRDLPDDLYPLRLVGPGLTEDEMPGGIVRIVVRVR